MTSSGDSTTRKIREGGRHDRSEKAWQGVQQGTQEKTGRGHGLRHAYEQQKAKHLETCKALSQLERELKSTRASLKNDHAEIKVLDKKITERGKAMELAGRNAPFTRIGGMGDSKKGIKDKFWEMPAQKKLLKRHAELWASVRSLTIYEEDQAKACKTLQAEVKSGYGQVAKMRANYEKKRKEYDKKFVKDLDRRIADKLWKDYVNSHKPKKIKEVKPKIAKKKTFKIEIAHPRPTGRATRYANVKRVDSRD